MTEAVSLFSLSHDVLRIANGKVKAIQKTVSRSKVLSLNAMILATKAGEHGAGFAVVAREAVDIADTIDSQARSLAQELAPTISVIEQFGTEVQGNRLTDLALHLIEIIDRNLYERSCDVRWWATDAAVIDCLAEPTAERCAHAGRRLGVILDSYTVYLDIWLADPHGTVVACGRAAQHPAVIGSSVADQSWFTKALATTAGDQFAVGEIAPCSGLDGRLVATYSTAVRAGGALDGAVLGVIGIHFNWQEQAKQVVESVRLSASEKPTTRCLIVDAHGLVLASSDGKGVLSERIELPREPSVGHVAENGRTIGFALTPGYESYRGLGWSGVIMQQQSSA